MMWLSHAYLSETILLCTLNLFNAIWTYAPTSHIQQSAYDHLREGGMINIHPRKNAVTSESEEAALRQRNQNIKTINEDGVLAWRRTSGYYRQSEAENMFFRYKKLFGDALNARNENSRLIESVIVCNILNQFRLLGKPEYELAG